MPETGSAMGRAIAIITAFCSAVAEEDEIDADAGECFFDILYDLEQPLIDATCEGEVEMARLEFSTTVIALAGIAKYLLEHTDSDLDKFELLSAIAENHYIGAGHE